MVSRTSRVKTVGLPALALLGTVGAFVFGIKAGTPGKDQLRYILLGAVCAAIPVSVTAVNRFLANRQLRAEVSAREHAVQERERALLSKQDVVRKAAEVQITAEARLIFALRARLSPVLYCLGNIAAASSSGMPVDPLIGSLTQAIVSAAIEHQFPAEPRRSIFFAIKGDLMDCAGYAGYEGKQDAALTVFTDSPDDPVGPDYRDDVFSFHYDQKTGEPRIAGLAERPRPAMLGHEQIGMTQPGGAHIDDYFAGQGGVYLDIVRRERIAGLHYQARAHQHHLPCSYIQYIGYRRLLRFGVRAGRSERSWRLPDVPACVLAGQVGAEALE